MSAGMRRTLVALFLVIASATATSGATYTASSGNNQAFTAATDFGVHVSIAATTPANLRANAAIDVDASETAGGTITQVVVERSPAGTNTWTTACTDTNGAPWQCSWDTTPVANGLYDLRARATNNNGYSRTSDPATRRVDNASPTLTMDDTVATWFKGTLTLRSSDAADTGGSGLASVKYEYKLSSAGTWSPACTGAAAAPFSCSFDSSTLSEGQNYDFRAVATDGAGNTTNSTALTNRKTDRTNPGGTLTTPAANLSGTVAVLFSASDATSGVASVTVQYAPAGTSSWSTACTDTTTPFTTCDWNTNLATDQLYDVRLAVTDIAGNAFNTAAAANRRVDNTLPLASLTVPPGILSGSGVGLSANATDDFGSGVKDVLFERSPSGANTWTSVCAADPSNPYGCNLDTTTLSEAIYDFRATATDNALNPGYSTVVSRRVDNLVPSPVDVQTANGGATQGVIEAGDSITFTYSEPLDPSTIVAGWDGSGQQSIFAAFTHAGSGDKVTFYGQNPYPVLPFGPTPTVDLKADFVSNANPSYTANLTRSGNSFTVTFVTPNAAGFNTSPAAAANMVWTPSAAAKDYANKGVSTSPATKTETNSGVADRDF